MRIVFVTGTDTGVGKTRVSCALVHAFRQAGHRVSAMKPVETGCVRVGERLVGDDARDLALALGHPEQEERLTVDRYLTPASPETAALLERRAPPALARIVAHHGQLAAGSELSLVEGAGGLLVPLDGTHDMADLALALGARLLVVARTGLGTINHTLLTIAHARQRGLDIAGVVLNQMSRDPGPEAPHVRARIESHGSIRCFGTLPFLEPRPSIEALAEQAKEHLDLQGLWEAL